MALGAVALALIAACKPNLPTNPDSAPLLVTVEATPANAFTPGDVFLMQGGAISWKFGSAGHNVIFDDDNAARPADISTTPSNVVVSRIFETPGVYEYECDLHPGMTGVVRVIKQKTNGSDGPS